MNRLMTNVVVEETGELKGSIVVPPSKSYTHRSIIAAALSAGESRLLSPLYCDDTDVTIKACTSFGVSIEQKEKELVVRGAPELKAPAEEIDCGESASTLRFLTPIAALARGKTVLTGSPGLLRRPVGPLVDALAKLGVQCTSNKGYPPVSVLGDGIKGGTASLVGNISSQYVTGLLLACPRAENSTMIILTTRLESKPYVELTLDIIRKHGIAVNASKNLRRFSITGGQDYRPCDHRVPGDFSSAAFMLAAAVVTRSRIRVEGLSLDQPDSQILEILRKMGADVDFSDGSVDVCGGDLKGISIDARDIPDLVPVCAVLGCFATGSTVIFNAGRLRIKESDRLGALPSELRKMGARIVETSDGLVVDGSCWLRGAVIDSHGDHRIAMACAVAALEARGKTEILGGECVSKSYPGFFEDLKMLGGRVSVG